MTFPTSRAAKIHGVAIRSIDPRREMSQSRHLVSHHFGRTLCIVPGFLSQRLLPVLQLTRAALVFTAISNSVCEVLLLARSRAGVNGGYTHFVQPSQMIAVILMSLGMYGFGMSLNDIIDRR